MGGGGTLNPLLSSRLPPQATPRRVTQLWVTQLEPGGRGGCGGGGGGVSAVPAGGFRPGLGTTHKLPDPPWGGGAENGLIEP